MAFNPFRLVLALAIYFPFEDFLLKWLPVSDRAYSLARFGGEAVAYGLLGLVLFNRLYSGRGLRRTPADAPLICFAALALFSIYINGAPLVGSIINLRSLLRYVAVYYAVSNMDPDRAQTKGLIYAMLGVGVIESLVGVSQYFTGVGAFWLPRSPELEVQGNEMSLAILAGGIEKGAVIGTFGHSVSMAMYLLICVTMTAALVSGPGRQKDANSTSMAALMAILFGGIFLTYSRSALFAAALSTALVFAFSRAWRPLISFCGIAVLFALLVINVGAVSDSDRLAGLSLKRQHISPLHNITMVFGRSYVEQTSGSRLWVLREVGGALLKSGTFAGFSPDEQTARGKVVSNSRGALKKLIAYRAFEDVYWVAMLSYYGIAGVGLFLLMLYRLFRCSVWTARNSPDPQERGIGASAAVLIAVSLPLTFLVQTFEIRIFSFYFWLLAGLAVSISSRHRIKYGQAAGPV